MTRALFHLLPHSLQGSDGTTKGHSQHTLRFDVAFSGGDLETGRRVKGPDRSIAGIFKPG